jgi:hypothetical protein
MREQQVRRSSISKEIEGGTGQDCVGNPIPVSELASCLFDLRAAHEAELRTLTWIQTTLEGIRSNRACGDPGLLFREMARLIKESEGASAALAGHRRSAAELLSSVIASDGRPAREPKPLTIVAA